MVVSTQSAVRVVPAPPVPPACVTDLQARIDQANWQKEQDALIQERLIEYFRDELPGLVEQKGLWNVVEALRVVLAEERSPTTGQEMTCSIILRPTSEANGWF
jgi:hypothetical protein